MFYSGDSEGEESDDDWDKDNEGGAELDMSVYMVDPDKTNNNKKQKQVQGTLDIGALTNVVAAIMKPMMELQAKKNETQEEILGQVAKVLDIQVQDSRAQAEERSKEKESRKRKEQEDELVKEDEVVVVERTLEIRDDSNSVIDINARSLLGIYRIRVFPRHFMSLFQEETPMPRPRSGGEERSNGRRWQSLWWGRCWNGAI